MLRHSIKLKGDFWKLSDFWKSIERASLYLMMFLAVAMLAMPLIQPQEAKAQVGVIILGLLTLAGWIYIHMCKRCYEVVGSGTHYYVCPRGHGYYLCESGYQWLHEPCHN